MVTLVWLLILSSSMIRALLHCVPHVHPKSWVKTFAAKRIPRSCQSSFHPPRFMSSSFTAKDSGSDGVLSPEPTVPLPPSSLLTYLRNRMVWGLETWKQPEIHRTASIEEAATTIVNFLLTTHYYHGGTASTSSGIGVATAVVEGPEQASSSLSSSAAAAASSSSSSSSSSSPSLSSSSSSSSESMSNPSSKERNKRLMDFGLTFAKALHANPG